MTDQPHRAAADGRRLAAADFARAALVSLALIGVVFGAMFLSGGGAPDQQAGPRGGPSLAPLLEAGFAVRLHVATVVIALAATAIILPLKKGTRLHKAAGRVWAVSMLTTALASFWITDLDEGSFSFIHIFSVVTLVNVPYAIWAIRRGDVVGHKLAMLGVVVGGLGIAGGFALAEGRIMHAVLFG